MDEYNRFYNLASSPFSCQSLRLFQAAVQIIRARYPNCLDTSGPLGGFVFPPYDDFCEPSSGLKIDPTWTDYARDISLQREPWGGEEITPSLWRLSRKGHLDRSIIDSYLQLLRNRGSSFSILEPRTLQDSIENLVAEQNQRPAIIPLMNGEQWSFMVLYPDCVHYFDSREDAPIPQCSTLPIMNWTGPKQEQPEDSGVFMLLGIRLLAEGRAHINQKEAQEIMAGFRSMVLIELLSTKLNPGPGEFEPLLERVHRSEMSFFEDATWLRQTLALTVDSPAPEVDRGGSTPAESVQDPAERNFIPTPRSLPRAAPDTPPDARRTILTVLSNAVVASRSTKTTAATRLEILWTIVKNGKSYSEFHTRYNGVLFYEKMQQQGGTDEMQRLLPKFQFWKELCSLYPNEGLARYTLLCAIPEGFNAARAPRHEQNEKIAEIQRRLTDVNDTLRDDLANAEELCRSIIESSLPNEILMIDLYKYRKQEILTDEWYKVLVSRNPRPRMRIPGAS